DWAKKELEKARKEAAGYRTKLREAEPFVKKAQELEEASKTDLEKLQARISELESANGDLTTYKLRREVADAKGVPAAWVNRLKGSTLEEMEADADELVALIPEPKKDDPITVKPREALPRGGGDPEDIPVDTDPAKLAALIPRD